MIWWVCCICSSWSRLKGFLHLFRMPSSHPANRMFWAHLPKSRVISKRSNLYTLSVFWELCSVCGELLSYFYLCAHRPNRASNLIQALFWKCNNIIGDVTEYPSMQCCKYLWLQNAISGHWNKKSDPKNKLFNNENGLKVIVYCCWFYQIQQRFFLFWCLFCVFWKCNK